MKILLIEDDKKLSSIIQKGLKEEKYIVDPAYDGENGKFLAGVNEYDVIILDLRLPKIDGYSLCTEVRKEGNKTPILMLTANNSIPQKIAGLDAGADDYMTKPFDFDELLARIRSLVRRKYLQMQSKLLTIRNIQMDLKSHEVLLSGEKVELSSLEFRLLKYFILNKNRVLTRTNISEHVWDMNYENDTNVIDVYVNYLRKKIDKNNEKIIHTIRGTGYIMKDNEN